MRVRGGSGGGQNLLKDVSSPACLCTAPPLGAETSLWVSHLGSRWVRWRDFSTHPHPRVAGGCEIFTSSQLPILSLSSFFLGPYRRHMEVPSKGSNLSCQPTPQQCRIQAESVTYTTVHQRRILNPLSEVRDRTWVLMDTRQVPYCWATVGTPPILSSTRQTWSGCKRSEVQQKLIEHCKSTIIKINFKKVQRLSNLPPGRRFIAGSAT